MKRKPVEPVRLCNFVRTNGVLCASPALKDRTYCYYHNREFQRRCNFLQKGLDAPPATEVESARFMETLDLPNFEDANSIQVALSNVARALWTNRIERSKGALILYSLKIAAKNVDKCDFNPAPSPIANALDDL